MNSKEGTFHLKKIRRGTQTLRKIKNPQISENMKERHHLEYLGTDFRIILKWIKRRYKRGMWCGCIWVGCGILTFFLETGSGPSVSTKGVKSSDYLSFSRRTLLQRITSAHQHFIANLRAVLSFFIMILTIRVQECLNCLFLVFDHFVK
jgi:hypothetical protein